MSDQKKKDFPYKPLGEWLKEMRQKNQYSVAEVSGAVEIESDDLTAMERGVTRPTEDILMLLISYFAIKEDDAVKVWELAGYTKPEKGDHKLPSPSADDAVQPVIVMPMDARIVYTDMASVQKSKYGLTINFMQSDGIGDKPLAVSRVGMSYEHAAKLLHTLQNALTPESPKLLPAPESQEEDKK